MITTNILKTKQNGGGYYVYSSKSKNQNALKYSSIFQYSVWDVIPKNEAKTNLKL